MSYGLTSKEVQERINNNKSNHCDLAITKSYKAIIYANVFTFFNLMNGLLFALILLVESYRNGLFIMTIVANTCVGIFQEIQAKKVLDKLAIIVQNIVEVYRDGELVECSISQLVIDDVVLLKSGMQIPCDGILLDGQIEVDESLITGESKQLSKFENAHLIGGSFVTSGQALYQITSVGKDNYASKILVDAKQMKANSSKLKKSINTILKVISIILIPMGMLLFFNQYYIVEASFQKSIVGMVGALVGMIPEGLVFLTSVALAISVIRLGKHNALVQDLFSVETLARVDTICFDKTGTLTQGKMKVVDSIAIDCIEFDEIMRNISHSIIVDNSTSKAIREAFDPIQNYELVDQLHFSSQRKYSAITFKGKGTYYLGASQMIFIENDEVSKITKKYSSMGYRVLFVGLNDNKIEEKITSEVKPIGYLLIQDQVKETAFQTIQYFYSQGVDCKVLSGDDPAVVSMIAKEVGIKEAHQAIDASQCTDEELRLAINQYHVFGRVSPNQKKILVDELQKNGHVVAMVGDGVNDVPSLKKANASIAMASGSDAAKNTANIVLLDSDFASIPYVVNEGRRVINNLRNAASMFLVKTSFSVLLSILTIIVGHAYPFEPIHLTIIGIFSIGLPTFLLQFEPSFQRVKSDFLSYSIQHALPSAIMIVLGVILGIILRINFELSQQLTTSFITFLTALIYSYTLYIVYKPLTTYRKVVICLMQILLALSFVFCHELLGLRNLTGTMWWVLLFYFVIVVLVINPLGKKVSQLFGLNNK